MATAKKTAAPKKETSTEVATTRKTYPIVNWDEELAKDAAQSSKMEESTATGSFFGTKAGVLTWNDAPVENNQIAAVIVDSVLENVSYDGEFDPDNPTAPRCFAYAYDESDLKPHQSVVDHDQAVHDTCAGCPRNAFGTAERGRGKACRNTRRIALLPAGKVDGNGKFTPEKKAEALETATMGFLKLPVTSVRAYSAFVKQVAASLKRPPHGIFVKVKVRPDAKNQFAIDFEPLGLIPNDLMGPVMARREEAKLSIMQPYNLDVEEAPAKPARGAKAPAKKAAGKPAAKAPARGRKF